MENKTDNTTQVTSNLTPVNTLEQGNQTPQPQANVITDVSTNDNSKAIVSVILGVLIGLALIGGGIYLFLINQPSAETPGVVQQPQVIEEVTTIQTELDGIQATEVETDLQEVDQQLQQL